MFKTFIRSALLATFSMITMAFSVYAQMEMPKPAEKKGLQSQTFGSEEEKKKLREMVKQNRPGVKPEKEVPPLPSYEEPSATTEKEKEKDQEESAPPEETPENRVWKQYKAISGNNETVKEEQKSEPREEAEEIDEEAQAQQEKNDKISDLLNQYKNRNKGEMTSRSFARPEDIEKSLQDKQESPAASGQIKNETAAQKNVQQKVKKKTAAAKKKASTQGSKKETEASYNK